MEFEEAYRKYRAGAASPQETEYVEDFVRKARKIGARRLNGDPVPEAPVQVPPAKEEPQAAAEPEPQPVKYGWHDFKLGVRHFFTALFTVVIIAAVVAGYGWFRGRLIANENLVVNTEEAKTAALTQVKDQYTYVTSQLTVGKCEKHLVFCLPMDECYYYYLVTVSSVSDNTTYQVWVSGSYAGVTRLLSK